MAASVPKKSATSRSKSMCTSDTIHLGQILLNTQFSASKLTNSAVETGWSTTAETVLPESLNRTVLNVLVACKSGEVKASQVKNRFAVGREFGPGTIGALDDWNSCEVVFLKLR